MSHVKPTVFVGSSTEGLQVAEVVESYLQSDFDTRLWNSGLFRPGLYSLESLDEALRHVDFAVIVGTPDDVLTKRDVTNDTVRDNLILELGLFMGVLGRRRAILLVPKDVQLALPSDLSGLTLGEYAVPATPGMSAELLHSLKKAANEICQVFATQVAERRQADAKRLAKIARGQRLMAVRQLLNAVVQLRDLCIELPGQVLDSLGDRAQFDEAKRRASAQVAKLHDGWRADARLLGVEKQLAALASATRATIEAFPFPSILRSDEDIRSVASRAFASSFGAYTGGKGVGAVADAAFEQLGQELERKAAALAESYRVWWNGRAVDLRRLANDVQDALAESAVTLGLEGNAE